MSGRRIDVEHQSPARRTGWRNDARARKRRALGWTAIGALLLCGSCSTADRSNTARPVARERRAGVARRPAPRSPHPIYYVDSESGDDTNSGATSARPWRTLVKVDTTALAPGAEILLKRGGRWTDPLVLTDSGTRALPIRVADYGAGPLPLIHDSDCIRVAGNYVHVANLAVEHCTWAGVEVNGSFAIVEHSTISSNVAGIVVGSRATFAVVRDDNLLNNNRMSVLTRTPNNDDSGAWGIVVRGDNADISYNTIAGSDAFSYDFGRDGAAIEIYGGINNHIHHNVAKNNNAFSELGDRRSSGNVYAYNLVTSTLPTSTGFVTRGAASVYGPVLATRIFNNTVVLSGARSQGFVCGGGCSGAILSMRNNIFVAAGKAGYADARFDEDDDVFSGGVTQFVLGPRSVFADPRFVDVRAGNFVPQPSSPAVDSGAPALYTTDLNGTSVPSDGNNDGVSLPDRGAFERPAAGAGALH